MSSAATVHRTAPLATSRRLPEAAAPPSGTGAAGRYRYDTTTGRWWWSPETFAVLGVTPTSAPPTVDQLMRAVHRDDRPRVRRALADLCTSGTPFAVEHRVLHADGRIRTVVLVGEVDPSPGGVPAAVRGLLVDVTEGRPAGPTAPDEQVQALETEIGQLRQAMASRAAIEQAKGVLMLLMGCGDQVAFDLLAHISSHTHRKVRDVAVAITTSASSGLPLPDDVREILRDACPPGAAQV
ncbi:MAG TPA: PAS and ANTAR domain-containing protein [Modestobacter sp.]|jgi:hypothetical protein|nr:PAS and ANTAR domain-containing protein [Modestobacter sp.]